MFRGCQSVCRHVFVCVCLPVCLVIHREVSVRVYMSVSVYMFVCLCLVSHRKASVCLCVSVCAPMCLFVSVCVSLSLCLCACVSLYLSECVWGQFKQEVGSGTVCPPPLSKDKSTVPTFSAPSSDLGRPSPHSSHTFSNVGETQLREQRGLAH